MATIVIGRKELFSFAERYSTRRLSDYTGLADGEVLCCLFNLVFPDLRIRPAPAQTHSNTQRAHVNWEQLFRRFAKLHIPLSFLDPAALQAGSVERGFSTLVVFYFFHHLSKRADFSAEFALDVAEEVTTYLQSTDCIATLLLGNALEWSAVPESLAEGLRAHPAFHTTAEAEMALEEEAARTYRSMIARRRKGSVAEANSPPVVRRAHPEAAEKRSGAGDLRPTGSSSSSLVSSSTPRLNDAGESPLLPPPPRTESAQSFRSSTSRVSSSDNADSRRDLRGRQRGSSCEMRRRSAEALGSSQRETQSQRCSSQCSASSSRSSGNSRFSATASLSRQSFDTAAPAVGQPSGMLYRSTSSMSNATASQESAVSSSRARDAALEAALQSKEAECESLQMQVAQLLTLLANARTAGTASGAASGRSDACSASPHTAEAVASVERGHGADGAPIAQMQQHYADHIEKLETQLRAYREASDNQQAPSSPPPLRAAPASSPLSGTTMDKAALEAEITALTANIVDDETGTTVVDVHEKANLLHCLMLEHLQESPRNRKQMQQWLWSIVAAHHTMEGRLMAAVNLLRLWSSTLPAAGSSATATSSAPTTSRETPTMAPRGQLAVAAPLSAGSTGSEADTADGKRSDRGAMAALRKAHYAELGALHAREHDLAAALQAAQAHNVSTVQRAVRRERLWKALCAAVYAAEQASYAITDCGTAMEVEERLRQREEHYRVVEALTQQLVEEGEQETETRRQPCKKETPAASSEPCASLQALVARLQEERAELLSDVARLHDVVEALQAENACTAYDDVRASNVLPTRPTYASVPAASFFSDDLYNKSAAVARDDAAGAGTALAATDPPRMPFSPGHTRTPRGLASLLQLREG
ncbi:hypothetical protein LSCM1_08051 [Leishmania martiniquensis]|uniref:Uncharacterized protein n=1 Tax=Leishmania martiniquensis TaxID=1580590 RepID=A0A836L3W9_9TRYP|nr:hypothetical protein LSCM1_08051 [Leishmania martiniquensis]